MLTIYCQSRKEVAMKARLANKILLGSEKNKNRYWLNRVVKAALGWKEDQRVAKALHVYHRKK